MPTPDTLLALKRQIANLRDLIEVESRRSEPDGHYLGRLQRNLDRALGRIYGANPGSGPEAEGDDQRTS